MKKYRFIVCLLGANALLWVAIGGAVHAEDRPRAARVDSTQTKESNGSTTQNKEAAKPAPALEKTTTNTGNRVHMGPTTVTVIDDGEAIDDVVSRVRQVRIDRLRQDEPRRDSKDRPSDRNPEGRLRREPFNRLETKLEGRREGKKLNDRSEDRGDKAEAREDRRDDASDKREERLERIKEKREQKSQMDRPVRGGRIEK